MEVRDVQRQFRYWGRFPPVRDLVAGYLGVKEIVNGGEPVEVSEEEAKRAFLMHGMG